MHDALHHINDSRVLRCDDAGPVLDAAGLHDLVGTALGHGAQWIAVPCTRLPAQFFDLRSGMAGHWLQTLVNYRLRVAVLGDVSALRQRSRALDALITETNRGRDGAFVADWPALQRWLQGTVPD
ncbi:DUF4180 domain-containing protein [Stenotrophomonas sp. 24(2023)]|uniref:DUF4180 domain-containing protein n=1 Tax=Stenotrophomonas sp. 24(2023) TaxID=3068324 RepID=UPI0027E1E64D|nr:DUF4180 domain-containing protein [Stenotrophomonas sp. 24(2023)]WMJ68924.1 DUF4180 domain-containing protein [Stenotrophomonas sp. 24(2023)]